MFLNNLSIYSVPIIGIVFLTIILSFSKIISIFTHQLSSRHYSVNNHNYGSHDTRISIQVNPFSQLDDIDNYHQRSTTIPFDDDEELIQLDVSSITATSFCENGLIELRLDQDLECDDDVENRNNN